MHSINKKIMFLFLFGLFFNAALAQDVITHCAQDETPLFSCTMRNDRILSVCSKEDNKFIAYRYGKPGQIEFSYPDQEVTADTAFAHSHYFRYRTDYFTLSFTNQNYRYAVFRYYSDDGGTDVESVDAGVSVTNLVSEKAYTNRCKTIEIDALSILRDFIPCDPDGDFGCK